MPSQDTWTASNAADLRAFLHSETGRMLLARLHDQLPKIKGTTLEQVALEGADVRGYLKCLEAIDRHGQSPKGGSKGRDYLDTSQE